MQPFTTNQLRLSDLIGNGKKFIVPRFQRDYSWTEEQWGDLWSDLQGIKIEQKDDSHYMGYLVLQEIDDNEYIIVDGQQRLTTLTILFIAACYVFDEMISNGQDVELNKINLDELKKYVGQLNPITKTLENKITLNRNNQHFFKTFLCQFSKNIPTTKIKSSEKLLKDAKDYFVKQLKSRFTTGQQIIEFILRTVSFRLYFTTIIVNDDINAYTIFETLNARGVQLSTPDLLKNYLLSLITKQKEHSSVIDNLDETWEKISEQIGENNFSDFVRHEWNSRFKSATKTELFRRIKSQITTPEASSEYISQLYTQSFNYSALLNPNDEMWISSEYTPEQQQQIKSILDLLVKFKIIQPISLLLATIIKYNKTDFIRLLRYIEVLSMRYNIICNLPPNDQESLYKNLAYQVTNNNLSILAIKEEFKKFYPSDKEFETAFIYKDFKQNQRAKYLLLKLQNYLDTSIGCFHESDLTIEHILPKEPTCEWLDKFKNPEAFIYKLGNMVLIPKKTNKDIDRKLFTDKKDLILKTSLAINNTIAEDEVWNESSIGKRQKYLAKQAKTIWRIDF
jgi:uncharacterized protein with ParB-like and HNH nuclease domain